MERPKAPATPGSDTHLYSPCLQHPAVTARTAEEVDAFRHSKQIHVYGEGVPKPVTNFIEASFPDYVLEEVLKAGMLLHHPAAASSILSGFVSGLCSPRKAHDKQPQLSEHIPLLSCPLFILSHPENVAELQDCVWL